MDKAIKGLRAPTNLPALTLDSLKESAREFAQTLSKTPISALYGTTDGKAVGTFVEGEFIKALRLTFDFQVGNAAKGIDIPDLNVDIKCTSIRQPQSSCPYRDASQKVYGLGYHLLLFVYEKSDDNKSRTATLQFRHVVFTHQDYTADFQCSNGILKILANNGNKDDVIAFLIEKNLPLDDIGFERLAERIMSDRPRVGYLTISNAQQWRLQYSRVIDVAVEGKEHRIEHLFQS